MDTILVIGNQILIMFVYMGIGWGLFRKNLVTREGSKSMAHLLLYCVLPSVVLRSFCIPRTRENTIELLWSFLLAAVLLGLSMAVSAIAFRKSPVDNFGVAFSNAGFMGFPLITAVMGAEATFYAAGFVALLNVLQWTYSQWVLTGDRRQMSPKAAATNPIVLALAAGLIVFFTGVPVPSLITTPMNALAALNGPLAMVVLGVYMAQADLGKMFVSLRLYRASALRLVVIPLLTLGVLAVLPSGLHDIGLALLLCAAAPAGSNVAVYAQKLDLDYTYAVQLVCVSTILSIITMPLVISLV